MSATELAETIYGSQDDSRAMSEHVQSLADSIYKEFERLIKDYDENVVKDLMPLVVGILEGLDQAVHEKQEGDVEIELVREDNEQLMTQYEREKQLRKTYEQKYLAYEDATEEERKQLQSKIESLESLLRLFEIKMKNAQEQISRFEDRESEAKKEYNKLHERYTDLFKAHVDFREKTKLMSYDRPSADVIITKRIIPVLMPGDHHAVTSFPSLSNQDSFTPRPDSSPSVSVTPDDHNRVNFEQEVNNLRSSDRVNATTTESVKRPKLGKETREVDMATDSVDVQERGTGTSDLGLYSLETPECEEVEDRFPDQRNNMTSVFDELSHQDMDALGQIDDGADITEAEPETDRDSNVSENFYGMSREVENLIEENNELLATKNALNVVKDDLIARVDQLTSEKEIFREEVQSLQVVKEKLKSRIAELEEQIKKMRESYEEEKQTKTQTGDEEDDVPMSQRKRFTRVEMARVLMERNQYKERLMELQEAVRWTEMIRASRLHPELIKKQKSSIWNFFSNLFSSSSRPPKKSLPMATIRYSAPSTSVKPIVDQNRQEKQGTRVKPFDFLQDDLQSVSSHEKSTFYIPVKDKNNFLVTDRARAGRGKDAKEEAVKMRSAAVKKDDGRLQAYGWSLPAKFSGHGLADTGSFRAAQLPIPIPIYCRPIMEDDNTLKVWCAAAVNITGGKTRDGGLIVGASIFYSSEPRDNVDKQPPGDEIEKLNQEIQEHEKEANSTAENQMKSSLVWICTSGRNGSEVAVVDANNPGDILDAFAVSSSNLLCIASVPGATEDDYPADNDDVLNCERSSAVKTALDAKDPGSSDIGYVTFVRCKLGDNGDDVINDDASATATGRDAENTPRSSITAVTADDLEKELSSQNQTDLTSKQGSGGSLRSRRGTREPDSQLVKDGIGCSNVLRGNDFVSAEMEKSNSVLPTMWIGAQSGSVYVHSAVSQWRRCLHTIRLKDSVLSISHVKGRVFVALADGTVAVFRRDSSGQWDLSDYHVVTLGEPQNSVRCICVVANKHVWCGYRNTIHILNPMTLQIEKSFDAHPRKESQLRQMAWVGEGVWISIRLDSTLRLYHAYTHEHLQDVDIEPYVSKLLGNGKLGFSFVRVSCLTISCNRLWIGTGNGVILSVPLSETNDTGILTSLSACDSNKQTLAPSAVGRPGGVIRVYSDSKSDSVFPGSFIPYCSIAQAQLSFHGHKDAVKFFVIVPGSPTRGVSGVASSSAGSSRSDKDTNVNRLDDGGNLNKNLLVISGGEGYVDFRIGEVEEEPVIRGEERKEMALSKGDCSHLIVWLMTPSSRRTLERYGITGNRRSQLAHQK